MPTPLMPKATAVWLIENTALSFQQIADFCGIHELEVQAIADGEAAFGIIGQDPIVTGQLTKDEITRCEKNPDLSLKLLATEVTSSSKRKGSARYTPVSKRQDRPDAIAWIIKFHPELTDLQIRKLLGTTQHTIDAVRKKEHWNTTNIKPRDPVTLGLCKELDLEKALIIARNKKGQA